MDTLLLYDHSFLVHEPADDHPESSWRMRSILRELTTLPQGCRMQLGARRATRADLLIVHGASYVDHVLAQADRHASLDGETHLSVGSVDAALAAAGAGIDLADAILDGACRNGFALTRPPGHHALHDRAMGYCIFNNVAIAAAHLLARGGARVMVVDWDVHHGNGTQEFAVREERVAFVSLHQAGLFPIGEGNESAGPRIVNVALPPGAGDPEWLAATSEAVGLAAALFEPEFVLVSAGFDAHQDDPTSEMQVTEDGFAAMCASVTRSAERFAQGRILLFLEGGYDTVSLGRCVRRCAEVLGSAAALEPEET